MEFGIFNLMGSRDPAKQTAEVFAEVAEQTRLADELGYAIARFGAAPRRASQVRTRLSAGGRWIRTLVPSRFVLEFDWRGLQLDEDTWSSSKVNR